LVEKGFSCIIKRQEYQSSLNKGNMVTH